MFTVVRKDCNGKPVPFNAVFNGQKLLLEYKCKSCGNPYWTSNYKAVVSSSSASDVDSDEAAPEVGAGKRPETPCGKCKKCTRKDIQRYQEESADILNAIGTLEGCSKFDDYKRRSHYNNVTQYLWEKYMIIGTRLSGKMQHLKSIKTNRPPPPSGVETSS